MFRISALARAFRLGTGMAAMLLAFATLSSAEPAPEAEAPATPWYTRIFGSSKPKPQPVAKSAAVAPKLITRQDVSRSLDQEQKLYMERLQFCTRLRQIAAENSDEKLLQQAESLEQQAFDVYMTRTKGLPTIVEDAKAAEAALERRRIEGPMGTAAAKEKEIVRRAPNGRPIRE